MRKIWTVYDNYNGEELGAYWHEDEALDAKQKVVILNPHPEYFYPEEDIVVESFTVYE